MTASQRRLQARQRIILRQHDWQDRQLVRPYYRRKPKKKSNIPSLVVTAVALLIGMAVLIVK